jgi:hydrogenase maturation protease
VKTLVAGIGSPILGDDGVGIHAIRRLKKKPLPDHVDTQEIGTAGLTLLDSVRGYHRLILVDAMKTGARPGTVAVLSAEEVARAVHLGSGHDADFPSALALGEKLLGEHMPAEVIVLAVEAANLSDFDERLSPEVEAALPEVLERIGHLIRKEHDHA